jgi:hypothetical protein
MPVDSYINCNWVRYKPKTSLGALNIDGLVRRVGLRVNVRGINTVNIVK